MQQRKFLPLGLKIGLVAASFSLPIIVLAFFVITNINADIRFSTLELAGNAYQRPLEKLLDNVQQYQLLTTTTVPADAPGPRREELSAEISSAFNALTTVDQQFGVDLQFTAEGLQKRGREKLTVELLRKQWQAIEALPQDAAITERATALDELVASLRGTITHAGDTSNLILDPDLDSYYLMDVTLLALPQTQDRLAKVTAFGRDRLQAGKWSAADRVQLAVFAAMLEEADQARIASSLQTCLNEDANFYGVSPTLVSAINYANEEYLRASSEFIALARQITLEHRGRRARPAPDGPHDGPRRPSHGGAGRLRRGLGGGLRVGVVHDAQHHAPPAGPSRVAKPRSRFVEEQRRDAVRIA
jgi:methyl-accepting chemotaxis protein